MVPISNRGDDQSHAANLGNELGHHKQIWRECVAWAPTWTAQKNIAKLPAVPLNGLCLDGLLSFFAPPTTRIPVSGDALILGLLLTNRVSRLFQLVFD